MSLTAITAVPGVVEKVHVEMRHKVKSAGEPFLLFKPDEGERYLVQSVMDDIDYVVTEIAREGDHVKKRDLLIGLD